MRDLVGERDRRAVQSAAGSITEQLNHRASAMRGLALQAAAGGSAEQALTDAAYLAPDFEGGLALFDAEGSLLAATNSNVLWESNSLKEGLLQINGGSESRRKARFLPAFPGPAPEETTHFVLAGGPTGLMAVGAFEPTSLARRALDDVFSVGDAASAFVVSSLV